MILTFYIARRFLTMFAMVFTVFLGILVLIDIVEQLSRSGTSASRAVTLALLNSPAGLFQILPLITMLSAIALFLALARSSELVVVRASGRSGLQFLLAPVMMALLLGGVAVAIFDPLAAATSKAYARMSASGQNGALMSVSRDGLWMRQGVADEGQAVINAARANVDGSVLYNLSILRFDPEGIPIERYEASEARLQPGYWLLQGAKRWDLTAANPERGASLVPADFRLPTELTIDRLREGFGKPSDIAIWKLPSHIAELQRAGFSARSHQVWLQMELALPLLLASMVLMAAGFTMRHARAGKTGQMVLFALLGGFGIFFLRNFAQVLGEAGQIPVVLAAWTPPLAASFLALGLLLHLEDG